MDTFFRKGKQYVYLIVFDSGISEYIFFDNLLVPFIVFSNSIAKDIFFDRFLIAIIILNNGITCLLYTSPSPRDCS